jgi:PAS domain S-box-containing protein
VVLGWATGIDWLERALLPGVVVKANTGISLMLLGLASLLTIRPGGSRIRRGIALGFACTAGLIAVLSLLEYAAGANFGIDNLLFRELPGAPETASAGRMALGTAIGLALLAIAIAPLTLTRTRTQIPAAPATLAATLAGLSILGHIYGSTELTGFGAGTLIAPATAISLGALSVGILVHPALRGPFDILWRATSGSRLARGFALASLGILPLLGIAGMAGVDAGWFGRGFEISLVIAIGAASVTIVGMMVADRLDRLSTEVQSTAGTLAAILHASPPGIIAIDTNSNVTFWSDGAERLYGWSAEEVIGRSPPTLAGLADGILADQWRRLHDGESLLREETSRRAKSGELIEVVVSVAPLHDSTGEIIGLLTVQEDIRERKRLETELVEAHKLQTVGRLAGGIAHNFNNILTAIIGFTNLALAEPLAPGVRSDLEAVNAAAARASGLTKQMLAFGRRQTLQEERLDVGPLLLELEPMVRQLVSDRVDLTVEADPQAGWFVGDGVQLEHVILNLALNASDAMPNGGRLDIRVARLDLRPDETAPHADMVPGEYVVVVVSDTGQGMDAETQTHIFEPFFTTKEVGMGTGLGLSTSYGIVKQMGGELLVDSAPGRGSTFRIYFPAIVAASPIGLLEESSVPRILLAEHDAGIRDLTMRALESAGFEVLAAADGPEALRRAGKAGLATIGMLMVGCDMPHMRGADLARRLRRQRPDLPVVFIAHDDSLCRDDDPGEHWTARPFDPDALVKLISTQIREAERLRNAQMAD